jgi:hypothetical protein
MTQLIIPWHEIARTAKRAGFGSAGVDGAGAIEELVVVVLE